MPVSERILTARLSRHFDISVVVGYAPTKVTSDGDKILFYLQSSSVFDGIPPHDLKLLLGLLVNIPFTAHQMIMVPGC